MLPPSQEREAQVSWEEKLRSEEGFLTGVSGSFPSVTDVLVKHKVLGAGVVLV